MHGDRPSAQPRALGGLFLGHLRRGAWGGKPPNLSNFQILVGGEDGGLLELGMSQAGLHRRVLPCAGMAAIARGRRPSPVRRAEPGTGQGPASGGAAPPAAAWLLPRGFLVFWGWRRSSFGHGQGRWQWQLGRERRRPLRQVELPSGCWSAGPSLPVPSPCSVPAFGRVRAGQPGLPFCFAVGAEGWRRVREHRGCFWAAGIP